MRPEYINVRALSANEGSGIADWPLVAPLACFPKDEEDIAERADPAIPHKSLGCATAGGEPHPVPRVAQLPRATLSNFHDLLSNHRG